MSIWGILIISSLLLVILIIGWLAVQMRRYRAETARLFDELVARKLIDEAPPPQAPPLPSGRPKLRVLRGGAITVPALLWLADKIKNKQSIVAAGGAVAVASVMALVLVPNGADGEKLAMPPAGIGEVANGIAAPAPDATDVTVDLDTSEPPDTPTPTETPTETDTAPLTSIEDMSIPEPIPEPPEPGGAPATPSEPEPGPDPTTEPTPESSPPPEPSPEPSPEPTPEPTSPPPPDKEEDDEDDGEDDRHDKDRECAETLLTRPIGTALDCVDEALTGLFG